MLERPVHRVSAFSKIVLYPPGLPPMEIDVRTVQGAGADPQTGLTLVVTRDPGTGIVTKYLGFPVRIEEAPPSGLLAVG